MSAAKIARRYAKAFVELSTTAGQVEADGAKLQSFVALWGSHDGIREVLRSPIVSLEEKHAVLAKVSEALGIQGLVRNFLRVLLENGRLQEIPEIGQAVARLRDEAAGRLRATVSSAAPMSDDELQRIQRALEKLTSRSVTVEAEVDESLIGGVVTRIGNTVLDGSVRTQLAKMHERLLA